jgi:hypothetical protein
MESDCQMSESPVQDLSSNSQIVDHVNQIKGLHEIFESTISQLRGNLDDFERQYSAEAMLAQADYWQFVIAYDSAIRLRLIIEGNLHNIETLSLLATVRYVFELLVWLKLAATREGYSLAYYGRLLEKSKEHAASHLKQLSAEVALLEKLEALDRDSVTEAARGIVNGDFSSGGANDGIRAAMSNVERLAARAFSLYADKGKNWGFGFTAHLIRTQAIPKAAEALTAADKQFNVFLSACPACARDLCPFGAGA